MLDDCSKYKNKKEKKEHAMEIKRIFFCFFVLSLLLSGCMPSVQEKNPGIDFLSQQAVIKALTGKTTESKMVITSYKEGGNADVYVISNGKDFNVRWSVKEDGKFVMIADKWISSGYFAMADDAVGLDFYKTDGSIIKITFK